jgi:hypothetical protein
MTKLARPVHAVKPCPEKWPVRLTTKTIVITVTTQRFSWFIKSTVIQQAFLIHYFAKNFWIVRHVLRTAISTREYIGHGEHWAVSSCRVTVLKQFPLWILLIIYRPRSVVICFLALRLYLHISGAVEYVAVRKRNIYFICFSDDSVTHKFVWSVVRESSISCYEPLIIYCTSSVIHVLVISIKWCCFSL